jgi:DNA invertase Pin-like site-specific DNA recombinase
MFVNGAAMTSSGKFVAYYRVSTARQGRSGLGLSAQQKAVADFLNGGDWKIVGEFTEIESGKKTDLNRPQLAAAFSLCRLHGAKLVIARLDRLSRNAAFLLSLEDSGIDFVAADMPNINRLTAGVSALVAEDYARAVSKSTKDALAAAKRRGVKLGGDRGVIPNKLAHKRSKEALQRRAAARAADLKPIINELQAAGVTTNKGIAAALTERGIPTARGAGQWQATQVKRVLDRLGD